MIFDSVGNFRRYLGISPLLDKALYFLYENGFADVKPGRYALDGDSVYYMVQEPALKPLEETRWEAHRQYVDIQLALAPGEAIACADAGKLDGWQAYDREHDIQFCDSGEEGILLPMEPGCFAVFFPSDAHRPVIRAGAAQSGRKVVFKVKA